jgi:putative membrane protein
MLKHLLFMWITVAIAIAITAALLPSVEVDGGFFGLLGVALIFGLVNALIGPLIRLISIPLTLMTLGLFALVINGLLLALTAGLSDNLDVGGFFAVILAAIFISVFTTILYFVAAHTIFRSEARV